MSRSIDPLIQEQRVRRPAAPAGRPLPPPLTTAAPAASRPASPAASRPASPPVPRPTVARRKGPARRSKVASLAVSVAATVGLGALFAQHDTSGASAADPLLDDLTTGVTVAPTSVASDQTLSSATVVTLDPAGVPTTSPAPTTVPAPSTGAIADGTYLGTPNSNRWGTVQVQAVYAGGSLVDVQILSYPDGDRKSIAINQRSLPTMIDGAISLQSADVAGVSGATYTWRSYRASLQSAIDAARAASGLG